MKSFTWPKERIGSDPANDKMFFEVKNSFLSFFGPEDEAPAARRNKSVPRQPRVASVSLGEPSVEPKERVGSDTANDKLLFEVKNSFLNFFGPEDGALMALPGETSQCPLNHMFHQSAFRNYRSTASPVHWKELNQLRQTTSCSSRSRTRL